MMKSDPTPKYQWAKSFPTLILASSHQFSCTSCDRTFNRRCDLNRHMKYHTRPYKCDQCSMPFSSPKDRSRHLDAAHRTASDEIILYCCTQRPCSETGGMIVHGLYTPRFKRKDNWKTHLRRKHNLHPQQIRQIQERGIPTAVFSPSRGWHNGPMEQFPQAVPTMHHKFFPKNNHTDLQEQFCVEEQLETVWGCYKYLVLVPLKLNLKVNAVVQNTAFC
ncbi:hypothetical protein BGZ60DRAFT_23142 [Tricladium varicosporioides]|nr:hypothetical protein BGZ60DRAFT_23142 [Hymenoscyphus varicosporioides]